MKGLFVSLLLAASVPAEAATFVWSGRPETFEHFAGPAPDELWAYSWYNEAELPPSPFYAAVKLGEFRGSNAEMSGLVGIWQYPTVTTTNRLNGQYVFLGSVESVAGPYAKKREVWLVLERAGVSPGHPADGEFGRLRRQFCACDLHRVLGAGHLTRAIAP